MSYRAAIRNVGLTLPAAVALSVCVVQAAEPSSNFEIKNTAPAEIEQLIESHLDQHLIRYRLLLPPHAEVAGRYRVELYGALDEYRSALAGRGVKAGNPACYLPAADLMLLGFDGANFDDALRIGREREAKKQAELDTLRRTFFAGQKEDEARFRRDNVPQPQREELRRRRSRDFQRASAAVEREIAEVEQKNLALLDEATNRLLATAAHELFHAYVENEAYPPQVGRLPPWLNEGLAQIVERADWRSNRPIVSRPNAALLKQLQSDIASGKAVGLRELLTADGAKYLTHDGAGQSAGADDARRYYAAAWGLAQQLAADGKLADRAALDRYAADSATDPVARFERFIGQPLAPFEAAWKTYVKNLR